LHLTGRSPDEKDSAVRSGRRTGLQRRDAGRATENSNRTLGLPRAGEVAACNVTDFAGGELEVINPWL
jgi:hypothetical protein